MGRNVLACVVQWDDDGTSRITIGGWSDCPHQRELMRQQAMDDIPPGTVEAVWFMEIQVPLTAPGSPTWQRVQDECHIEWRDRDEG